MFLWYKYPIVSLVFSHLGFWSGNLSLIAPFPDLCLLVPFCWIMAHNIFMFFFVVVVVFRIYLQDQVVCSYLVSSLKKLWQLYTEFSSM